MEEERILEDALERSRDENPKKRSRPSGNTANITPRFDVKLDLRAKSILAREDSNELARLGSIDQLVSRWSDVEQLLDAVNTGFAESVPYGKWTVAEQFRHDGYVSQYSLFRQRGQELMILFDRVAGSFRSFVVSRHDVQENTKIFEKIRSVKIGDGLAYDILAKDVVVDKKAPEFLKKYQVISRYYIFVPESVMQGIKD